MMMLWGWQRLRTVYSIQDLNNTLHMHQSRFQGSVSDDSTLKDDK